MTMKNFVTMDGNEAVAGVAFQLNEVVALFPITPASPMGEWADAWAAAGVKNLWGTVPAVIEMQSEGGAAGAIHGALQTGALSTTFTASQGLLLMIPNMYKIAGELTPFVLHVAARSVAAHALSIFGDHSDVMAARTTGFALLCAASVQEAQDFTLIAHAATLESRIPFLFFMDGFRTSHEIAKIEPLAQGTLRAMMNEERVREHRERALSPDHPVIRGTAQNPDVFFQAREGANRFYDACPGIVQRAMDSFTELTGRPYHLFDYHGANGAERLIVLMGSGCEAVHETVDFLNRRGERVGVLKVRLFRPWSASAFLETLPETVQSIAVLDRTKEPGSGGEPLYLDCVNTLHEAGRTALPVVGGRYGLSSKEFTPAMVKAVFDNLAAATPKNHFTIGIQDDVTGTSLDFDPSFSIEENDVFRGVFFGLGSDGTVGANKESIKIIGENTDHFAQAYFVYDSKKAGAVTMSHLRFGPRPVRSTYLISQANFVGCHQSGFLERYGVLEPLIPGGTFLLNTPFGPDEIWDQLSESLQRQLVEKRPKFFVINAHQVASECRMSGRINTIMQTCFFTISGVLPREQALTAIKDSIRKTYGKKGGEIVQMNLHAVDQTLAHLFEVQIPEKSQRQRVAELKRQLATLEPGDAQRLLHVADTLVRKSVWVIGGDGWGYDIGYGGLDHVLASGCNVKVLLLDTEVYSNTGGQCSKATPLGAIAKFASAGKRVPKKDLGLISMTYGNIYVTCVAMGAKDEHTLKAFLEAEAYNGPALIIAYSHCIAHGINMPSAMQNQKAAVLSGQWLLYRYNPDLAARGENPLHLDSAAPKLPVADYLNLENRFKMLSRSRPEEAKLLFKQAQQNVDARWQQYHRLAENVSKEKEKVVS
jgi:pyruvate-ferredoxin/flavodoxin oxidoreductase